MQYIILLIGTVILYFAVSKYLSRKPENFNDIFRKVLAIVLGMSAFVILVKGNIAVAGVLGTAAVLSWQGSLWAFLQAKAEGSQVPGTAKNTMSREQALEILELNGKPNDTEIKASHHRLMKKIHPDQGGSEYFATQLNQAKDLLMKK